MYKQIYTETESLYLPIRVRGMPYSSEDMAVHFPVPF